MTTHEPPPNGQRVTFEALGVSGSISGKDILLVVMLGGSLGLGLWLHERRLDGLSKVAGQDHERIIRELTSIHDRLDEFEPRPAPRGR